MLHVLGRTHRRPGKIHITVLSFGRETGRVGKKGDARDGGAAALVSIRVIGRHLERISRGSGQARLFATRHIDGKGESFGRVVEIGFESRKVAVSVGWRIPGKDETVLVARHPEIGHVAWRGRVRRDGTHRINGGQRIAHEIHSHHGKPVGRSLGEVCHGVGEGACVDRGSRSQAGDVVEEGIRHVDAIEINVTMGGLVVSGPVKGHRVAYTVPMGVQVGYGQGRRIVVHNFRCDHGALVACPVRGYETERVGSALEGDRVLPDGVRRVSHHLLTVEEDAGVSLLDTLNGLLGVLGRSRDRVELGFGGRRRVKGESVLDGRPFVAYIVLQLHIHGIGPIEERSCRGENHGPAVQWGPCAGHGLLVDILEGKYCPGLTQATRQFLIGQSHSLRGCFEEGIVFRRDCVDSRRDRVNQNVYPGGGPPVPRRIFQPDLQRVEILIQKKGSRPLTRAGSGPMSHEISFDTLPFFIREGPVVNEKFDDIALPAAVVGPVLGQTIRSNIARGDKG